MKNCLRKGGKGKGKGGEGVGEEQKRVREGNEENEELLGKVINSGRSVRRVSACVCDRKIIER